MIRRPSGIVVLVCCLACTPAAPSDRPIRPTLTSTTVPAPKPPPPLVPPRPGTTAVELVAPGCEGAEPDDRVHLIVLDVSHTDGGPMPAAHTGVPAAEVVTAPTREGSGTLTVRLLPAELAALDVEHHAGLLSCALLAHPETELPAASSPSEQPRASYWSIVSEPTHLAAERIPRQEMGAPTEGTSTSKAADPSTLSARITAGMEAVSLILQRASRIEEGDHLDRIRPANPLACA